MSVEKQHPSPVTQCAPCSHPHPQGNPGTQRVLRRESAVGKCAGWPGYCVQVLEVISLHPLSPTALLSSYFGRAALPESASLSPSIGRGESKWKTLAPVPGSAQRTLCHKYVASPFIQVKRRRLRQAATQVCLVPRFQTYHQAMGKREVTG